jgi:ribose/xylose/arabinose/galactoside ABC-type transport system permease subunit
MGVYLRRYGQRLAVPITLLLFVAYVGASEPNFLTAGNFANIGSSVSPIAIVAMGMGLLLISGNFDLSVGGVGAFGVVAGSLIINDSGTAVGVVAVLAIGLLCGALNGTLVTVVGVNSLVATLGTGFVWSGMAYVLAGSSPVILNSNVLANAITSDVGGVPVSVIVWISVVAVTLWYSRTIGGKSLYAVGANREAARLAGVPVRLVSFIPFVLTGLFAGAAALVTIAFVGGGVPETGSDWPLEAIAATVVGGISITGGEGSVFAAVIGIVLIGVVQNGLVQVNINTNLQTVVLGIIIIAAVAADASFRRRLRSSIAATKRPRVTSTTASGEDAATSHTEREVITFETATSAEQHH